MIKRKADGPLSAKKKKLSTEKNSTEKNRMLKHERLNPVGGRILAVAKPSVQRMTSASET
jgi:hypothetical protein